MLGSTQETAAVTLDNQVVFPKAKRPKIHFAELAKKGAFDKLPIGWFVDSWL